MTDIRDGGSPEDTTAPVRHLSGASPGRDAHRDALDALDVLEASRDRQPSTLGRHLDIYLAAVADELHAWGVITGSPQRRDPDHQLIGVHRARHHRAAPGRLGPHRPDRHQRVPRRRAAPQRPAPRRRDLGGVPVRAAL